MWTTINESKELQLSSTARLPQEVLLCIISSVVEQWQPPDKEGYMAALENGSLDRLKRPQDGRATFGVSALRTFALVCRAWYTRVAPSLYGVLEVTDSRIGGSGSRTLRASTAQLARLISVRGQRIIASSARAATLFPNALAMVWHSSIDPYSIIIKRNQTIFIPTSSPSEARIYTRLHSSFSHLLYLELRHCVFLDPSDLQRLLAAFPSLIHAALHGVFLISDRRDESAGGGSRTISTTPSQPRHLRYMTIHSPGPVVTHGSFASYFSWHLLPSRQLPFGFPGLPWSETQVIIELHNALTLDRSSDFSVHAMVTACNCKCAPGPDHDTYLAGLLSWYHRGSIVQNLFHSHRVLRRVGRFRAHFPAFHGAHSPSFAAL